jgi:hypothetical protein
MRKSVLMLIIVTLSLCVVGVSTTRSTPATSAPPTLGGCPIFPVDNIWNVPVDTLPVDPNSNAYINTIGADANVHADFGSGLWDGAPIGIPYVVVPGNQPKVTIHWTAYGNESDPGPYPVPTAAPIEGAPNTNGDRHVLVVRQGECKLYELYRAFPNADGSWNADSGAVYTLTVNGPLRPAGWTSADAAGLPMLPGLARYDEVAAGEINHALRFTVPQTRNTYVWPARHFASDLTGSQYPPMGQRFRLKTSFYIDPNQFSPDAQLILRALKKYGLILADNGSSWYISGAPDGRWNNDVLHELDVVVGSDFEAVDVSSLMVDPNSGQTLQGFSLIAAPSMRAIEAGSVTYFVVTVERTAAFTPTVSLVTSSPSLSLTVHLSQAMIAPPGSVTLTVTDTHPIGSPATWYTLPITATGGGVTHSATVGLLLSGKGIFLPIVLKQTVP